ncbi:MAG: hypothetical protein WBM80_09960 [Woeseiaceae bacterium]
MALESEYCAHNYHPPPVVLTRGERVFIGGDLGAMDRLPVGSFAQPGNRFYA